MSLYLELSRLRRRTEQRRAKDPATPAASGEGRRACKGPQTSWKTFCVCKPAIEIGLNFESEPKLLLNSGVGLARGRKKNLAGGRKVAKQVTRGGGRISRVRLRRGGHISRVCRSWGANLRMSEFSTRANLRAPKKYKTFPVIAGG